MANNADGSGALVGDTGESIEAWFSGYISDYVTDDLSYIVKSPEELSIHLDAELLFTPGSDQLTDDARRVLANIAKP